MKKHTVVDLSMPVNEDTMVFPGDAVLFYTGAGDNFAAQSYTSDYPKIELDLANLLIEKGVKLVGADEVTPMPHREIERTIPSAIILSSDGKLLMGKKILQKEVFTPTPGISLAEPNSLSRLVTWMRQRAYRSCFIFVTL